MPHSDLEAEIAAATGESVRTIRRRGFSLWNPLRVVPLDDHPQAEPRLVDWDAVQAERRSAA